jgi:hypothetical protein
VVLHLITVKCLPISFHALDVCSITVVDKRFLDFVFTQTFSKYFVTNVVDNTDEIVSSTKFSISDLSQLITEHKSGFLSKFLGGSDLVRCLINIAHNELIALI